MPKLNQETAKAVENAEGGSFEPVPEGRYTLRLRGVEVREGAKGPYWSWEYEIPEGREHAGRRFWNNTSLTPAAAWKVKESFDAFGVSADTDTDELCGRLVSAHITVRTINQGARAGELTNQIESLFPYEGDGADDPELDEEF